ncbi:DNA-processing protein DprA [Alkalihalobacillus sp. AL-G]|uniref:DNA-processing protein DprA n=1 Tax=Alkalihalobacillus sp. AL-G TaxID=2926399 RepID=UPI00272B9B1C|nr:DNA-processing protein DprA [Alkalihalobacillus sp. AL-G]WLD93360.1 DNA-protecting protein DprA [Alkalihalobacillus sp. AL-G]
MNIKNTLLLLKQFGFSDKTLETFYKYEDEKSIMKSIFDKNYAFYNKYFDSYTKKEIELSEDVRVLIKFSEEFKEKMREYKRKGIKVFFKFDQDYPEHIFPPDKKPLFLYCYGNVDLLNSSLKKAAIIGTRDSTEKGENQTRKYVRQYINEGWATVSGLAKGIDTIVHRETIDSKGYTIAVLPTSFEKIYPAENKSLADEIVENKGLLITRLGPFENTFKSHFLERNSFVAKISDDILIIEASIKSGTLNTVRQGYEQNKAIYYDPSLLNDDVINYIKKFDAKEFFKREG